LTLPNIVLPGVPSGGQSSNVEVRRWGTARTDSVRPHWEIGKELGLLDVERGVKISGAGFMAFREQGAALMRALFNLCLDMHTRKHGYEEVRVPSLVSARTMRGTGQLPKFQEDLYQVGSLEDDLYLIPTAEVPITNLYRDEAFASADLPKGFVAHTSCFRREAGAHGKDTRGLLRLHEFDKVELVRYVAPEDSEQQLEHLTNDAEAVLQELGLPYRVLLLAAGDTGFAASKTYDLEVWAPGVNQWLEVSSCSTFGDFQARRAGLRYRDQHNKLRFLHTLNGSGLAFPRTIAAILEHYQQPDGSVVVPGALRPYLGVGVLVAGKPVQKAGLLRR
jgi:seryl-tRNA synthetase